MSHTNHRRRGKPQRRRFGLPRGGRRGCLSQYLGGLTSHANALGKAAWKKITRRQARSQRRQELNQDRPPQALPYFRHPKM